MPALPERIGKYEILALVGRGGMGTVYRARDPILDRIVALKTMFKDVLSEHGMRDRFLREARSAARLQHPNIVTIFEFGEVDETPFIAMEFLEGDDLNDAVAKGRLPDLPSKLNVLAQVCDGLAYAHAHGVIHRDVKPSNVTILPTGAVKLVDFGIARLEGGTLATRTGEVLGTPAYMAPEQFAGEKVDHRVDEWATGVILYELVTGKRPFAGNTVPSLIFQILHNPPPPLDAGLGVVASGVAGILEKALAKDPEQRFRDLTAMGQALRDVATGTARLERVPASDAVELLAEPLRTPGQAEPGLARLPAPAGARLPSRPFPVRAPTPGPRTPTTRQMAYVEDGAFGEPRRVQTMLLSPDESVLVVGGTDGSIRLWDLEARMKVETLRNRVHMRSGHGSLTTALAISEDGALLASGHLDGAVYLWEVATGLELDVKLGHDGAVGGVGLPPGGRLLVTGGADEAIKFWDLPAALARDPRRVLRRQPDAVLCLAIAKMGKLVVTGHTNRSLRVHDTADQRLVATLHGHHAPLSALAVSPIGPVVASGARDGAIRIHHLDSRELVGAYQEHTRVVADLCFFPDGLRVASVAMDNVIVIWDPKAPEDPLLLTGSADEGFAAVRVTSDGRRLIAATAEGRFRVWLFQA